MSKDAKGVEGGFFRKSKMSKWGGWKKNTTIERRGGGVQGQGEF